jgi:Peptidase_C39 like family/Carboxypeptidase regulatory-like domain
LTLTSAWRPLVLLLGLVVALVQPGVRPGVFAADKDTGSISGSVVAEVGGGNPKPVANAEVRLTFGSKSDTRRTGPDGKYTFVQLFPAKYTVTVIAPDGLKTKGDGTTSVTLAAGKAERADFVLISPATPTPAPTPTPVPTAKATSSPKPVVNQNAAPNASALMPALVVPYASPPPAGVQARNGQPSGGPASLSSSIGVAATPGPVAVGTPSLIFAIGPPTPQANPTGTRAPTAGDDVVASESPRRLITSFAALRETGSGGAAAQLRSWATETSLVLGVPFRTQIDGTSFSLVNCGPASLAMVLLAFGLDVDPPSVRDYLNFLVGNYDTEAGTSLYALARIAREAGLSTFGTSSGLQGWTIDAVREHVRAGHPVITLTKYRFLPGHFGSLTDFDHYIVITGLAGEDFVYNDAAYSTEYGYNLLISPAQLQRAWAASSVPRHAMAIGFGDSLRPLPIVPSRLTAESLAVVEPSDEIQAVAEAPIRINRGPAAERLRERTLDLLGARTMLVDGEPLGPAARVAPPTRLDPGEVAVHERPIEAALTTSYERPFDVTASDVADQSDPIADARDATLDAGSMSSGTDLVPPAAEQADVKDPALAGRIPPIGLALMGLTILLMLGGSLAGWRRRESQLQAAMLPALVAGWWQRGRRTVTTFNWRGWRNRLPAPVTLPSLTALADRLPRRR